MIKKILNRLFYFGVLLLALCHMGTIRRDEDPIAKTQTDPIGLKQKMEEIKDGVKGAPTPSFKYYDKEDFLARSPMKSAQEEDVPKAKSENDLDTITEVQTQPIEKLEEKPVEVEESDVEASVPPQEDAAKEKEDDWWVEDKN